MKTGATKKDLDSKEKEITETWNDMNNVQGDCTEVQRDMNHWNYTEYMKFAECCVSDIAADNLLEAINNKK